MMYTTATSGDVVSVQMPATMNTLMRTLAERLISRSEDGRYELRHDALWWSSFFKSLDDESIDADVALEQLQAVIDDWNVTMADGAAATPIPI